MRRSTGPEHAIIVANRACRAALGDRGVAHLTISKDLQKMTLAADKRSAHNPGALTSVMVCTKSPIGWRRRTAAFCVAR